MTYLRTAKGCLFMGAVVSCLLLFGFTQTVRADERDYRHREYREFRDQRHNHDHYYPARGQFIEVLPRGHQVVFFGKIKYYCFEGIWYRPAGRRFLIAAPPFGLIVPFLPPYYTTIWVSGSPYYYANEVYYTQTPGGYVVVAPPKGEVYPSPSLAGPPPFGPPPSGPIPSGQPPSAQIPASQIFIYPRQGQSPQKQATDRQECHNWAVSQTGFDPTKQPTGLPETQIMQRQADFLRAQGACLDGRGYTVR
jgi:hypothetical protein